MDEGTIIQICFRDFLPIFEISEKRVRKIRELKLIGETHEDKQTKGKIHTLPGEIHNLLGEPIKSFPQNLITVVEKPTTKG